MEHTVIFYINNKEYKKRVFKNEEKAWKYVDKIADAIEKKYSEEYEVVTTSSSLNSGKYLLYNEKKNTAITFHYIVLDNTQMQDFDNHDIYVGDFLIKKNAFEAAKLSDDPIMKICDNLFTIGNGCTIFLNGLYLRSLYHDFASCNYPTIPDLTDLKTETLKEYVRFNMEAFYECRHSGKKIDFNKLLLKNKPNNYGK